MIGLAWIVLRPCRALAALGLLASAAAHVASLWGKGLPMPLFIALHVGIFVVWLPTMFLANWMVKGVRRGDFWKVVLIGCPLWLRMAIPILFAYAIVNFVIAVRHLANVNVAPVAGSAEMVRAASGHWMVFYAVAFATLSSAYAVGYARLHRRRAMSGAR